MRISVGCSYHTELECFVIHFEDKTLIEDFFFVGGSLKGLVMAKKDSTAPNGYGNTGIITTWKH
jgi:hypothetical protein